ncbi:hypothetical protein LCGC14_2548750 [marine sediment metagenome]|uniref:PIN domain-containing protein n=1 Tax=marine sediment metagenome TaxID=412755 RepID=A0A0F9CZT8_9ZZZZ|nr:putative toxin-antitoxin system toxin component, PIN family [Desulfobacterales bacterium]
MRVVIDTNVVISALLFGGDLEYIINLWKSRKIIPDATKEIIDEYLRVLAYPKFKLIPKEIEFLLYREIVPFFEIVEVKSDKKIVKSDPSDDKFIHCAEAGKAEFIISGDQHLINLGQYGKIAIFKAKEFLVKFKL